jgi:hypothetical protein
MPLPLVADSLDAVPEPLRAAYVERDGKFHLDAEIEDAAPIKAKAAELLNETKAERRKRQEAEQRLAALEQEREAAAAGLTAEKLAEIRKQAEDRYKPIVEENATLKSQIRARDLDGTVKGLLAKANAVDIEDAWRVVGHEFDLTDDGKVFLKANPTADVESYITKELVAKKGHLFRGTQAAGGGAAGQQNANGGGGSGAKPVVQWTSDERAAYIEQHGVEAHQQLLNDYMRATVLKAKAAA